MPNRIIRAGINRSERINQLNAAEEVFYRRLLNEVDDHGLFDARPAILRATLYALRLDQVREADISRWMAACQKAGLIVLYAVNEASGQRRFLKTDDAGAVRLVPSEKPYLQVLNTRWKARSEPKFPLPVNGQLADEDNPDPPADDCEQLRADENNCSQPPADVGNSPQLRPYSNTYSNTKSASFGSPPADGMTPAQRLGERLQDFFPALATNRPQLEKVFAALQEREWTADTLEGWRGWYREGWPRSQMSHFNLLNTVNDYDERRAKPNGKAQYCGNCNGGWRLPDAAKGESGAQRCGCVEVR